jgi:hypothetical protein
MAGENPPRNKMDAIVVARYAPLVLPTQLKMKFILMDSKWTSAA